MAQNKAVITQWVPKFLNFACFEKQNKKTDTSKDKNKPYIMPHFSGDMTDSFALV